MTDGQNLVNGLLRCPKCGWDYVHITSVVVVARDAEDAETTLIEVGGGGRVDREGVRDPMTGHDLRGNDRRTSFTLVGACESCDCEFAICFKNHKGEVHVGTSIRTWLPT